MFKVNISNSKQDLSWSAGFETQELAQAWLSQQIGKPHRLPERVVAIDPSGLSYDQSDVLEVIETEQVIGYNAVPRVAQQQQLDAEGNPVLDAQSQPVYQEVPVLDAEGIQIIDQVPDLAMVQTHVRLKAQFTSEIIDISAELDFAQKQAEARKLLAETDWMIIREMDSGVPCPQDIKEKRAAARLIL